MNLRHLLPRRARCAYQRVFVDGVARQCPNQIGWIALLFGAVLCREHEEGARLG